MELGPRSEQEPPPPPQQQQEEDYFQPPPPPMAMEGKSDEPQPKLEPCVEEKPTVGSLFAKNKRIPEVAVGAIAWARIGTSGLRLGFERRRQGWSPHVTFTPMA